MPEKALSICDYLEKIQDIMTSMPGLGEWTSEIECSDAKLVSYLAATIYPKWYWKKPNGDQELALGKRRSIEKGNDEPGHSEILRIVEGEPGNWYGGIGFSESVSRQWKGIPQEWFFTPYLLVRKSQVGFTLSAFWSEEKLDVDKKMIIDLLTLLNSNFQVQEGCQKSELSLRERSDTPQINNWKNTIDDVVKEIKAERYGKCVLARQTSLAFSEKVKAEGVFQEITSSQVNCYHMFVALSPDITWISFTPEVLYKRQGNLIESMALAGTKPRGGTQELDSRLETELLTSQKERNEHQYVSDFIEKKLNERCLEILKSNQDIILKQQYVQHVIQEFKGILKPGITDAELVSDLHPTPAVCGYPQQRAFEAIRRNEPFDRGWYAGVFGCMSNASAEWVVGIRSALVRGQNIYIYAGAGIVEGSEPEKEWQEIEDKMKPFLAWSTKTV